MRSIAYIMILGFLAGSASQPLMAQIDPTERHLIQLGYNQPLSGSPPLAGYAFYYRNEPGFIRTNLTLRLAIAPVYLDSELGIHGVLGENTDLGVGLAGGGYADSYQEMREGRYLRSESFSGHAAETSLSLYHLFNPDQKIPLNAIVRTSVRKSFYERDGKTDSQFTIPEDKDTLAVRTGLRWGGREPLLSPDAALELSAWYEGQWRNAVSPYGFNGDRSVGRDAHLVWARALFAYTLPEAQHHFEVSLTGGLSMHADRFSGYRLGSILPMASELTLSLPGYFYQEITAKRFFHVSGLYSVPLDVHKNWYASAMAASAVVDYVPGLEQPGHWHSGVSGGILYRSPSRAWQVGVSYGYGIDAMRSDGRGAHSIGILCQIDLHPTKGTLMEPGKLPDESRGLMKFIHNNL